jgi:Concanavalin A-like lectin/glucanases superfamily
MSRELLALRVAGGAIFDDSPDGLALKTSGAAVTALAAGEATFAKTSRVTVTPSDRFDAVDAFTLEVRATASALGEEQVVVDSDRPHVRLTVRGDGAVVGEVQTEKGWESVQSSRKIAAGKRSEIRFVRAAGGRLTLELDGAQSAAAVGGAKLAAPGGKGMSIGTDLSGKRGFQGALGAIALLPEAVTSADLRKRAERAKATSAALQQRLGSAVAFTPWGPKADHRFDEIKGIMRAVGVEAISSLATLTISEPTTVPPNHVMKAPPKRHGRPDTGGFGAVAGEFNNKLKTSPHEASAIIDAVAPRIPAVRARAAAHPGQAKAVAGKPPARVGRSANGAVDPGSWPASELRSSAPQPAQSSQLPVDTSVIIAGRLDLTDTELVIATEVQKLYIIAEEIEARKGARITWKRPTLSVPDHGPDPGKDGESHGTSTILLKPNARCGKDGGDGQSGDGGIAGRNGADAPYIEIWAKHFIGMPSIDVGGQDGGRGGKGQRGGNGGSGARGKAAKYRDWGLFNTCYEYPGDGGDGGDGARGGDGGRGGNGGDCGRVTIAVLEDKAADIFKGGPFTPLFNGGAAGRGGDGGDGGKGGAGGRPGPTEVCRAGRKGDDGSQGQPGSDGPDGKAGNEGDLDIVEIDEAAWTEQLTKPWLTHLTPTSAFPGTNITLRGSSFAADDSVVLREDSSDGKAPTESIAPHVLRKDGGVDFALPSDTRGGERSVYVRRAGGQESNRLRVGIRPHLDVAPATLSADSDVRLEGMAFVPGATVTLNGEHYPATVINRSRLTFRMPGTSGKLNAEKLYGLTVVNPDGGSSNELKATQQRTLSNGFTLGVHDYSFANFGDGVPTWKTFEDTFGAAEVVHELLDPVFGHPVLTGAFFIFYRKYLKGTDKDGLATGFCTSLASTALDLYWTGHDDTFAKRTKAEMHSRLTSVHGRLLSRENLLTMHDQGLAGAAGVETTFRTIEKEFLSGGTRETAPILFFIPAGEVWDKGYMDRMKESHCVVPINITYPPGHDGTSIDGVDLQVWDNNNPNDPNCRVQFRRVDGKLVFRYMKGTNVRFSSEEGLLTLGTQTLGQYLISDVDLPFSGAFGLETFVIDFLLSPARLMVTDGQGRRTGSALRNVLCEIPDSHPAYLAPGMFLLPVETPLTRSITGSDAGTYGYTSINPAGVSLNLRDVPTKRNAVDVVAINADGSRSRFIPSEPKTVNASVASQFEGQARGLEIRNFTASPAAELDITATPDLAIVRIANRGEATALPLKLFGVGVKSKATVTRDLGTVNVPAKSDVVVAVSDWAKLAADSVSAVAVAADP